MDPGLPRDRKQRLESFDGDRELLRCIKVQDMHGRRQREEG